MLGEEKTDYFKAEAVVRQGCVLSPILFSLYINNLAKEIQVSEIGVVIEDRRIAVLLYADDIVVVTSDAKYLQRGLRIVTD